MNESDIRDIVREVLKNGGLATAGATEKACSAPSGDTAPCGGEIPLEVSARHVHLTREAVETLFGAGVRLTKKRELSQPGEFLSEQRVKLVTAKGVIENVAVLGPERAAVQVELSLTDCRALGVTAPVNLSGDLAGAGDVILVTEHGVLNAKGAVIAARAHVHMTPRDAEAFGVKNGDHVSLGIKSARPLTLDDVIVRVKENFSLACHIDFDEANAANTACGAIAVLKSVNDVPCVTPKKPLRVEPAPVTAQQKLITEELAKSMRQTGGTVYIQKGTIVTPAARDVFSASHMKIEIV